MRKSEYRSIQQSIKGVIFFILIPVLLLLGCSKYDEGPRVSLKTKTKRLAKTWNLIEIDGLTYIEDMYQSKLVDTVDLGYCNNVLIEAELEDFNIQFEIDKDRDIDIYASYYMRLTHLDRYIWNQESTIVSSEIIELNLRGNWEYSPGKTEMEVEFFENEFSEEFRDFRKRDYRILKLTSDELILKTKNGAKWSFEPSLPLDQ